MTARSAASSAIMDHGCVSQMRSSVKCRIPKRPMPNIVHVIKDGVTSFGHFGGYPSSLHKPRESFLALLNAL